ncbi:Hypothetical predicted protein [Mytilus galloprovincialis]|uniref:Uncharacterized protein n=1 Tax=Mytilus galloprovincialis TaxID=29158 RepID=A0A8B6HER9_MYTGA|nr:Hypothetical predicted protein [Mytilus galloprovincialis]
MCQTGLGIEQIGESKDGNLNFDHVTLRARTQLYNCTCLVFIENQSLFGTQMYIEPYERLQSSAPKESECGLELYLDNYQEETLQTGRKMSPLRCTSGQTSRALSFLRNNVLSFISKVIDGNFTRGYCIDIQRVDPLNSNYSVQMADVLDVFKLIVRQIEGGKIALTIRRLSIIEQGNLQCLMQLTLHLIRLFQFIGGRVNERVDFIEQVAHLVQLDPREINNQTLLHLAVDPDISKVGDVSLMKFPSVYVVDILLICGANTYIRSDDGHDPPIKSIKFSDLPSGKV